MRTITVRKLSENLFNEIKNLPVLVTRYGEPYCLIKKGDAIEIKMEDITKDPVVKVLKPETVKKHEKEFLKKELKEPPEYNGPQFSDIKKEGYHFSPILGKYIKD